MTLLENFRLDKVKLSSLKRGVIFCDLRRAVKDKVLEHFLLQKVSEQDSYRLVIITYIGLGLSILGCLLTFIFYIALQ